MLPSPGELATSIEPPARFQRTEIFELIGPPGSLVTVEFEEQPGGSTLATMTMLFEDKAGRDMCLQSGMEKGVEEVYANLDAIIASER